MRPSTFAGTTTSCIALLLATGCSNFHVVDEGHCYRSAQLSPEELARRIEAHGIRTVVNLRGANPGRDWYDQEREVTRALTVEQIDIPMSAQRLPHREDLLRLLQVLENAERPLLFHCHSGADRTGLASALYELEVLGRSREEALRQLAFEYWHLSCLRPSPRYFVELYAGAAWAREHYWPCASNFEHYDRDAYCSPDRADSNAYQHQAP